MKKRFWAILLAAALTLGLAACGNGAEPADTTTTAGGAAETTEAPAETGDNSVTVWCWDPAFNLYAMETAAEYYKEDNPDFEINIVETPWDDVQTKLTTAATSNQLDTLPDIFLMQDNAFQKNVKNYPQVFTDLTDSGISFGDFADFKVAYSVVDGKNYGVPFDAGTVVTALRTDYMEEAGVTVDDFTGKTWAEWMEVGQKLDEAGYPVFSMTPEPDLIMMML